MNAFLPKSTFLLTAFVAAVTPLTVPIAGQAQSATATISEVPSTGGYYYTLTLDNTGTIPLEGFWYGWTQSGNNLPSNPSNPGNSIGWTSTLFGNSIMYQGGPGTALAPSHKATFNFSSTSTLSEITAGSSGQSVAYAGSINFGQNVPGDSTPVFSPSFQVVPEPEVFGFVFAGGAALFAIGWRKSRAHSKSQ